MDNILIFEGAGWSSAKHNGVGNCRIRTKLKNNDCEIIYLELGGHETNKFKTQISHCFNMEDERTNHTHGLSSLERKSFKYTKKNILDFVNKHLNCSFKDIIINNENLRVHDVDCVCYSKVV